MNASHCGAITGCTCLESSLRMVHEMLPTSFHNCPYRDQTALNDGNETAVCDVLRRVTGTDSEALCRVPDHVCARCFNEGTPHPNQMNGAHVQWLYGKTLEIIEQGGVAGCDAKLAAKVKSVAYHKIPIVPGKGETNRTSDRYTGPCFYLGDRVDGAKHGRAEGVLGNVYQCEHELKQETHILNCLKCQYYEPALKQCAVAKWSVGITTARRADATLQRTVQSLASAGWPRPLVFAEPDAPIPEDFDNSLLVRRTTQLGAWPNWLLGLSELVLRSPHADAYLMCQDDAVFCSGLRAYLETNLWPSSRVGVVSLYCPSHASAGRPAGFSQVAHGWNTWGALAYVFPNESAHALLRNASVIAHRKRGPADGKRNVDSVVGRWCVEAGLPYFVHTPSLVQHIGKTSTLYRSATADGNRRASTFIGEKVDVRRVLEQPAHNAFQTRASTNGGCHVAVSIPVFGATRTLRRAVEGILNQSHRELTLFVTNDGGESPWEELEGIDDPRLLRFDLPSNRGRYFADGVVLEATDAPFFLVQDADDWSEPNRLAVLLRHLQEKNAVGAVSSRVLHAGGRNAGKTILRTHDVDGAPPPTYRHRVHHHGLFRTRALQKIGGFYGGFRIAYDTFMMNLLLLTGRVAFVDEPLYHYVQRPDSLSNHPESGMHSTKRKEVRQQLGELYDSAFRIYLRFIHGELSHSQLCSNVRELASRAVTASERQELTIQSQRLIACLRLQREPVM